VSDAQVITMQTDGTVEADASAPDLGFDSAVVDAGRALDSEMADAEPLNDAAPIDAAPADPSIQRIQRGLEVAGSQVDLFDVIIGSPFGRDGVFISDGRSDAYSGLWVSFDESVNLPDWPMGASISVTGVVTERSYEGEMDEVVTGTRTQLNVGSLDAIERTVDRDLPAPVSVGLGELAIPEIAELFEGVLVSVSGVEVTRTLRGGGIILNGILTVDTHFIPEVHAWAVNGLEFEEVIGIVDFRAEGFVLVPRVDADMPRPPASLGDCFPIGGAYSLCTDGKHWRRAQDACAVNGARLVILETAEENQAVADMVSPWHDGSFWIGLSDRETEGEFIWHNGAPLEYSGWANNEPNDHGAGEDCAESSWGGTGVWNDARCNQGRVYVCEYAEAAPPCMGEGICPDGARCGEGVCQRPMAGD
jgi:hypothetical protein